MPWTTCTILMYLKQFERLFCVDVSTIFKVVTKFISNHIKSFLGKLIGPQQTSFLKGRRAIDNVVIIKDIVHHLHNSKSSKESLILKIDLEKVFHIEWSFIYPTLLLFKFPQKIIKLIMCYVIISRITILVNGTKMDYFSPFRNIFHGDHVFIHFYPIDKIIINVY